MASQYAEAPPACRERAYLLSFAGRIAVMHQATDQAVLFAEIVSLAHERFGLRDQQLFAFLTGR